MGPPLENTDTDTVARAAALAMVCLLFDFSGMPARVGQKQFHELPFPFL